MASGELQASLVYTAVPGLHSETLFQKQNKQNPNPANCPCCVLPRQGTRTGWVWRLWKWSSCLHSLTRWPWISNPSFSLRVSWFKKKVHRKQQVFRQTWPLWGVWQQCQVPAEHPLLSPSKSATPMKEVAFLRKWVDKWPEIQPFPSWKKFIKKKYA